MVMLRSGQARARGTGHRGRLRHQQATRLRQRTPQGLGRRHRRAHPAYSSGAVEGHVNRPKVSDRQMYDERNPGLLRKRLLLADSRQLSQSRNSAVETAPPWLVAAPARKA